MGRLNSRLAASIGLFTSSSGLMLAHFRPFGRGDVLDGAYGLVVGIGFGLMLAGFLKGRRARGA
jgi:hypothetical protein